MGKMNRLKCFLEGKMGYYIYLFLLAVLLFFCWRNANVLHLYLGPTHTGYNDSTDGKSIWKGYSWSGQMEVEEKALWGVSLLFETERDGDWQKDAEEDILITVSMLEGEDILWQWTFSREDIRPRSAYKCILPEEIGYSGQKMYTINVSSDAKTVETGVKVLDFQPVLYKVRAQIIKPILGIFVFLVFFVVVQMGKSGKEIYEKYFFMAGIFGMCYLLFLPYGRIPDEVSHFLRIYEITEGHVTSEKVTIEGGMEIRGRELPVGIDGGINQHTTVFQDMLDQSDLRIGTEQQWYEFSNMALYSPVSYLPQIVGVAFGRLFSDHVYVLIYMGRIFSFFVTLLLVSYALKILPVKKECMFLIAVLPIFFQEMVSLSADSFINALALFLTAYIFSLVYGSKAVESKNKYVLYVLAALLALCKVVYVPLVFLCFLVPNEKFRNRKEAWCCKLFTIGLAIGTNIAWTMVGNIGAAVSASGEGMSQTEWILKYPWGFVNVAYRTVMEFGDNVFLEFLGNSLGGLNIKIDELPLLFLGAVMLLYAIIPVGKTGIAIRGGV